MPLWPRAGKYEHFMRCGLYKGIEEPLVRDQDIPLLKKGEKSRGAMERELGKEGHRKGLWHMVIAKSPYGGDSRSIRWRWKPWPTGCCDVWWSICRSAWREGRRNSRFEV